MKIATFNINGVNQRLESLLSWLKTSRPDVACLQELKAEQNRFPMKAIRDSGYGAIWLGQTSWNGVAILARDTDPIETRRGLPGDDSDTQSRYIEAAVNGILVGCLYLPNGNPQPGPKFDYKLAWFERLIKYGAELLSHQQPIVLCGDFNVVPTDIDIYDTKSWKKNALLQPASRAAYARLLDQGWTDSLRHIHPDERIYTFWDYFRNHWARDAGLRIDHLLLSPALKNRLRKAQVDRYVRDHGHASDHAPVWIELADTGRAMKSSASSKSPAKIPRKTAAAAPSAPTPVLPAGKVSVLGVTLSHPDKALWPSHEEEPAVTKLELARYFEAVGEWMLPHLEGRPCSLVRAPDGVRREQFFQRHASPGMSSLFTQAKVRGDKSPYVQIDRIDALIAAAQIGSLELHPWNCAPGEPEVAGRLVFDLDPAPDVAFEEVIKAAKEIKSRLAKVGLQSFCKRRAARGCTWSHRSWVARRVSNGPAVRISLTSSARRWLKTVPQNTSITCRKPNARARSSWITCATIEPPPPSPCSRPVLGPAPPSRCRLPGHNYERA